MKLKDAMQQQADVICKTESEKTIVIAILEANGISLKSNNHKGIPCKISLFQCSEYDINTCNHTLYKEIPALNFIYDNGELLKLKTHNMNREDILRSEETAKLVNEFIGKSPIQPTYITWQQFVEQKLNEGKFKTEAIVVKELSRKILK